MTDTMNCVWLYWWCIEQKKRSEDNVGMESGMESDTQTARCHVRRCRWQQRHRGHVNRNQRFAGSRGSCIYTI